MYHNILIKSIYHCFFIFVHVSCSIGLRIQRKSNGILKIAKRPFNLRPHGFRNYLQDLSLTCVRNISVFKLGSGFIWARVAIHKCGAIGSWIFTQMKTGHSGQYLSNMQLRVTSLQAYWTLLRVNECHNGLILY